MSSKRKKERRRLRYERNVKKEKEHKLAAWGRGKLIEENRSNDDYSPEYTNALAERLVGILKKGVSGADGDNERFLKWYRMYRMKIRDLMIFWNDTEPKTPEVYHLLKNSLEFYWDTPETLLENLTILFYRYHND